MKNTIIGLCFFILIQNALFSAPPKLYEKLNSNNDHGFWAIEQIQAKLVDEWSTLIQFQQRWGSDYRLFWHNQIEFILFYDLTKAIQKRYCLPKNCIFKSFNLGAGYVFVERLQRNTRGIFHWVPFTRPQLEANLNLEWKDWELTQRIRGEYICYKEPHYKSHGTCRYRIQINSPWSWTDIKINPYISNEFFFRDNTYSKSHTTGLVGVYYENRFRIGLNSRLCDDKLTLDVFWQWRPLKQRPDTHPHWFNTYAFGLRARASF